MKNYSLLFSFLFAPLFLFSQNWVTESKSCGSCGGIVSKTAKVGDRCPHCGVTWGRENTTRTSSSYYDYTPSYNYSSYGYPSYNYSSVAIDSYATTRKNTNLRSSASTKSSVKTVIPAYSSVYVLKKSGNWYYVRYETASRDYWGLIRQEMLYGWVYYNLLF